jgi:hypothetical protein
MPLFKRKDKTTIAELEDYYANQKKNSSGRAWFMALLSLFITLAVLAGLFFGGRWLYRLVTNDPAVTITATGRRSDQTQDGVPSSGEIQTESSSNSDDTAITNRSSDSSETSEGVVSNEAATTTRDVAGENTDTLPAGDTIAATTELPDTGANELIALMPLLALVTGYLYSRNRQLNN